MAAEGGDVIRCSGFFAKPTFVNLMKPSTLALFEEIFSSPLI